ncbi:MAG: Cthe_2314 family HEPN domain-containing protein [Cyclobacteriaceae bacterium]
MYYKDDRHKLTWDFQREVIDIYRAENLNSLEGLDREFLINGRNILSWYHEVVQLGQAEFKDFNFNKCFDDLCFCCDEIMYFTALLYLYRPYIFDPLQNGVQHAGKTVYVYTRTVETKRFNMFANTACEKVYNYWDRIGDLIATYFPDIIDPSRAYFATTVDRIPQLLHGSQNYAWLKEFRNNEFKGLNSKRKEVVHYSTIETDFKHGHLIDPTDRDVIEKLMNDQKSLPDYFKNQLQLSIQGFEKTILFIEEINQLRQRTEG